MSTTINSKTIGKQITSSIYIAQQYPQQEKQNGKTDQQYETSSHLQYLLQYKDYNENVFSMEESPLKSTEKDLSIGIMEPMYINVKSNNVKKMAKTFNMDNQNQDNKVYTKSKFINKSKNDDVYDSIFDNMNEYFNLMKMKSYVPSSYSKNNRKYRPETTNKSVKVVRKKKVDTHKFFEDDDDEGVNFQVLGFKPFKSTQLSKQQLKKIDTHNQPEDNKHNFFFSSTFDLPRKQNEKQEVSRAHTATQKKLEVNQIKKKRQSMTVLKTRVRKEDFHYIFGVTSATFNLEQTNRLKYLYFRDFLWKVCFNRGFMYNFSQSKNLKYFVGRGNNSKLIRRIMSKRPHWFEDYKQQNAIFVWTQLKVYDIYKNQQSFNRLDKIEAQEQQKVQFLAQDKNSYILNSKAYGKWRQNIKKYAQVQKKANEEISHRRQLNRQIVKKEVTFKKVSNHLQMSRIIGNKKALYKLMMNFFRLVKPQLEDIYVPLTFHLVSGLEDEEYLKFLNTYYKKNKEGQNCWIVKPGEMSNRGNGIKFCRNLAEIKQIVKKKSTHSNGTSKTFLIQQYLQRPLLYKGRKFDIRHYFMVNSIEGVIRGYTYEDGYIRTSSFKYNTKNNSPLIHLTNDAVQKHAKQYGKYEKGNKLSYQEFETYLTNQKQQSFYKIIYPQIKDIIKDIIIGSYYSIDPHRRANNFQIFGIDIMVDQNFKCWLIEVNTNPCLQLSAPILKQIIPKMIDNALSLSIDSLTFPFENPIKRSKVYEENYLLENKFELVFDEEMDGSKYSKIFQDQDDQFNGFGDDDENYESCESDDDA